MPTIENDEFPNHGWRGSNTTGLSSPAGTDPLREYKG